MKATFSTLDDCIHVYAQFSQTQGKSGNVFFEDTTLYSYGYHFPLAHRTIGSKGETAILLNGKTYSNSTTRHQNIAQAATRQYKQVVSFGLSRYTKDGPDAHEANENHYVREYNRIAERLAVAKKPEIYTNEAQALNIQAWKYFDFFGITPSTEYQEAYNNATEISEELRIKVKARQAEALQRKKEREAEEKKAYEIKVQEWITGERPNLYPRPHYDLLRILPSGFIQTSQNIEMTRDEAKAIYLQIASQQLKVGDQVLNRYTVGKVNGTIQIGCHTFETAYLLKFGEELTGVNPDFVQMMEETKNIKNS